MRAALTHLSQLFDLEAGAADDAAGLALVDQQPQLTVEVHVLVLLILKQNH